MLLLFLLDFYVSWARSDPVYQNYFPGCRLLISPHFVRQSWHAGLFQRQPAKLLIDSGAYWYIYKKEVPPPPKEVFFRQLTMAEGATCPTTICHFDMPLQPKDVQAQINYGRIETTIGNAYDFMELYNKSNLPKNIKSLGVIQGYDEYSIKFCAQELVRLGFDYFGLGSLAGLHHPETIISRVKSAMEIVGTNLHIFGISNTQIIFDLAKRGISSFDSSRPIRAAIYNTIFYSKPFRSFVVQGAKNEPRRTPIIEEPLPCECPVCRENPLLLMRTGRKKYHNLRAVHNYYHLITEINQHCLLSNPDKEILA